MEFTKQDISQIDNLIKALKKGTYTLEGLEVLALADCFKWTNRLLNIATEEVKHKELMEKMALEAPKPTVVEKEEVVATAPQEPIAEEGLTKKKRK